MSAFGGPATPIDALAAKIVAEVVKRTGGVLRG
jgi:hypothetical protein